MKRILFGLMVLAGIVSCGSDSGTEDAIDNFDRTSMLTNWADNIIVPAYEQYVSDLAVLQSSAESFATQPSESGLVALRSAWLTAYTSWQWVSMFEIGKAEEVSLRNFTNIFPTDADEIESHISSGSYNLALPSTNDAQGFPALDYMINGLGENDAAIVAIYNNSSSGHAYVTYLSDLVNRLESLGSEVSSDWQSGYRDVFVGSDGSSGTSSTNKLINDFVFYYEKFLRAGKVGIPAGVFSGSPISGAVEALYHGEASKTLLQEALQASIDFFNGKHFGSSSEGESLKAYLNYLNTIRNGENLASLITDQFAVAQSKTASLDNNFVEQISTDNVGMLETYDELQKNVVLMKTDMLQAFNVRVDYVDADGD